MKSAKEIQNEGDGIRILTRKDFGAAFKSARAKKVQFTSFFTRRLKPPTLTK